MKDLIVFTAILLFEFTLSLTANAQPPTQSASQSNRFQIYPWSEDSDYARVDKSVLRELSITPVTMTNFETRQFVLTDEFMVAFKLTPLEIQQISGALADALHDYRTLEGKHLEPIDQPPKVVRGNEPWVGADAKYSFRRLFFPQAAAAIRKRLEQVVMSSLGPERSKLFWESRLILDGEMSASSEVVWNSDGSRTAVTYCFLLPAAHPGRVDIYLTYSGGSHGWTWGEPLDQYAPETLKPILTRWRKDAAKSAAKTNIPPTSQAALPPQAKENDSTKVTPANLAEPSEQKKTQSASAPQNTSRWDDTVPFVDLSKTLIRTLKIPGLTLDEELSPESAAVFGLSEVEQEAVRGLYREMKTRFEKLEREHLQRVEPGRNSFVLKAFPEKSAALKREWGDKLKELVGQTRGSLLDHSIRTDMTMLQIMKRDAIRRRMLWGGGPTWLHRGTAVSRLNVTTGVDQNDLPNVQQLDFQEEGEGGERSSGGVPDGQVPARWRHLLTPEILGQPLKL
ncbi:MAG: hypothetical protein HY043_13610 [Verrucomicrobia bacterium]|nr:hypothetical protein [Verrucomicrobiota bacterium]